MTLFVNNSFKNFAAKKNYSRSRRSSTPVMLGKNKHNNKSAMYKKNTDNSSITSMLSSLSASSTTIKLHTMGAIQSMTILGGEYNIFVPHGSDIYKEIKQNNPMLYGIAMMDESWNTEIVNTYDDSENYDDYLEYDYENEMEYDAYENMWSEYDRICEMYD